MELKLCPICSSKLYDMGEKYKCSVCRIEFSKELTARLRIFGISKSVKRTDKVRTSEVAIAGTYFLTPLKGGKAIKPKTFQYFKTMMRMLVEAEPDYICVEVQMKPAQEHVLKRVADAPAEITIGLKPNVIYKVKSVYVVVGGRRTRVCVPRHAYAYTKYKRLYSLLLALFTR
jgi:hypothetical protein